MLGLVALVLVVQGLGAAIGEADTRPRVRTVELHGGDGERPALLLAVRDFRSGEGGSVDAFRKFGSLPVDAQRVRGSNGRWRIGPNAKGGRRLLHGLVKTLRNQGAVHLWAGVPASGPHGGKLSAFRITAFDEPTPPVEG